MGEYDTSIAMAQRLIAKKGKIVTWRQLVESTADPSKPWTRTQSQVDTQVSIVFLTLDTQLYKTLLYLTGTEVRTGSFYGLMGSVGITPSLKDVVIDGSREITIKNIDTLEPNGTVVLHTVEFNK